LLRVGSFGDLGAEVGGPVFVAVLLHLLDFDALTENERNAMFDECFEYDDHLRANGHFPAGAALQAPGNALTAASHLSPAPGRRSTWWPAI
jgi:hypothetical protein